MIYNNSFRIIFVNFLNIVKYKINCVIDVYNIYKLVETWSDLSVGYLTCIVYVEKVNGFES